MDQPAKPQGLRTLRILVVDDETNSRAPVAEYWRDDGHDVRVAADGFKALGRVGDDWEPELLITDLQMPGMDGVELFGKLRQRFPKLAVIVMTAHATVETAVDAMRLGADDYMIKPVHFAELEMSVNRVMAHHALVEDHQRLTELLDSANDRARGDKVPMIGESRVFKELVALSRQVAAAGAPIVIQGPEGSGKRHVVRAMAEWTAGAGNPFVEFDASMMSADVVAEALTNALDDAKGGTLALLGVSELPPDAQNVLVRFLDEGAEEGPRLVSTTTTGLAELAEAGEFRSDLVYRLGVVQLRVPSLLERREDLPLLAAHFVRIHGDACGRYRLRLSERALGALENFSWPGNVRQLDAYLQRAVVVARGRQIEARDLPSEVLAREDTKSGGPPTVPGSTLADIERHAILATLESTGGSTSRAAKILGISVRKVQYRLSQDRVDD
jgi:two-component system response regulator HydG